MFRSCCKRGTFIIYQPDALANQHGGQTVMKGLSQGFSAVTEDVTEEFRRRVSSHYEAAKVKSLSRDPDLPDSLDNGVVTRLVM